MKLIKLISTANGTEYLLPERVYLSNLSNQLLILNFHDL